MSQEARIYQHQDQEGNLIYPQTVVQAVIDPETGETVNQVLDSFREEIEEDHGKAISSTTIKYAQGDSATTVPTDATWTDAIPVIDSGKYLWTKITITFVNGTSTNAYTVSPGAASDAVRYGTSQSLTESQKKQARSNINAADTEGFYPNLHTGVSDNLQDKGDVQPDQEILFRPTAGTLSVGTGQATIEKIKGKTIVWNQLVQNGDFSDGTTGWQRYNSTISVANNELTVTKTNEAGAVGGFAQSTSFESNTTHKYYISANLKTGGGETVSFGFYSNHTMSGNTIINTINHNYEHVSSIVSPKNVGDTLCIRIGNSQSETGSTGYARSVICIDLTQMFGAGNEPSTVAEFEALFPKSYYNYNPGQLISFNGEEIKTTGFNQWDEEWEVGALNAETGLPISRGNSIRSKNFIEVFPSTAYYYNIPSNYIPVIYYYDANKQFIKRYVGSTQPSKQTTPTNCRYVKWHTSSSATITTYNHDICINLHHTGIRDGQYEPYTEHTKTLPDLSNFDVTYTGADGQTHIAGGLKSAGSVYDEQTGTKDIRRIGVVDLGTLNYTPYQDRYYSTDLDNSAKESGKTICERYPSIKNEDKNVWLDNGTHGRFYIQDSSYSDAASLKASLAGVLLYYELETPVETEVQSRNMYYSVDDYGTEQLLPENTSVPTTTPMIADIKYGFNAVDLVRTIPDLTGRVEELEETSASSQSDISKINNDIQSLNSVDDALLHPQTPSALPELCGQPMILFGNGTPQESIVPINWHQYDPATDTGYNWNGLPSALGQQYINTAGGTTGRYIGVKDGEYKLKWQNC